jgi:uncharacterized phage-associated protein
MKPMPINQKKYQDAVLYLCQKLGGEIRGKKKLAKLLYFADFDFYEKYQKSITGDIYKAYPKGPLPEALNSVLEELSKEKLLSISHIKEWGKDYAPTEVFKCSADSDTSTLTLEERQMLDRIVRRYGGLNGEQLAELSHTEAPFTAAEPYQEIAYEFAYYRGTDFKDL